MSGSYIPGQLLDTVVSKEHIGKIASFLRNWEELSPHLGLTPEKETEIRNTFWDYGVQKKEILLEWKKIKGAAATYKAFIAAARSTSNVKLVEDVEDLLWKKEGTTTSSKLKRNVLLHYFMRGSHFKMARYSLVQIGVPRETSLESL